MLSDDQYEQISSFLPGKASEPGRTAADNRLFVEAVVTNNIYKLIEYPGALQVVNFAEGKV
ncbi:hypothetical protein CE195_00295, partial [Sodalis-like symbiont of Philaenus spumarius]